MPPVKAPAPLFFDKLARRLLDIINKSSAFQRRSKGSQIHRPVVYHALAFEGLHLNGIVIYDLRRNALAPPSVVVLVVRGSKIMLAAHAD